MKISLRNTVRFFDVNHGLILSLALAIFLVGGCTTLKVTSLPAGASVKLLSGPGGKDIVLGETPFESSLPVEVSDRGSALIEISKSGYEPKTILVTNLSLGEVALETSLKIDSRSSTKQMNRVITLAFRAERYLAEGRIDEAMKAAEELKSINDNLAISYQIEGAAYVLRNEMDKGRHAFEQALSLNPDDAEIQETLEQLWGKGPKKGVQGSGIESGVEAESGVEVESGVEAESGAEAGSGVEAAQESATQQ